MAQAGPAAAMVTRRGGVIAAYVQHGHTLSADARPQLADQRDSLGHYIATHGLDFQRPVCHAYCQPGFPLAGALSSELSELEAKKKQLCHKHYHDAAF